MVSTIEYIPKGRARSYIVRHWLFFSFLLFAGTEALQLNISTNNNKGIRVLPRLSRFHQNISIINLKRVVCGGAVILC